MPSKKAARISNRYRPNVFEEVGVLWTNLMAARFMPGANISVSICPASLSRARLLARSLPTISATIIPAVIKRTASIFRRVGAYARFSDLVGP
jgi:hypothetical protein